MKIKHVAIILILTVISLPVLYSSLFNNTLCVDQWQSFIDTTPVRPLRIISSWWLGVMGDHLGHQPYLIYLFNFVFHIINTLIIYIICNKNTNNNLIGLLVAGLFGFSALISEALFWPVFYPFLATIMLLVYYLSLGDMEIYKSTILIVCCVVSSLYLEIGLLSPLIIIGTLQSFKGKYVREKITVALVSLSICGILVLYSATKYNTADSLGYNLFGVHVLIKIITSWLIIIVSPLYQNVKLLIHNTIITVSITIVLITAVIALVKYKVGKINLFVLIYNIFLISLMIAIFSGFKESGIPVMASRYFYIPFAFYVIQVAYLLNKGTYKIKYAIPIACIGLVLNIFPIIHYSNRWNERTTINKYIIEKAKNSVKNGKKEVTICIDTTNSYKGVTLPPEQGYNVVLPLSIEAMIMYETNNAIRPHVRFMSPNEASRDCDYIVNRKSVGLQ